MQGLLIKVKLDSKEVGMYLTPENCNQQLAQLIISERLTHEEGMYLKNTIIKDVRILHSQYLNQLKRSQPLLSTSHRYLIQQPEPLDDCERTPPPVVKNRHSNSKIQQNPESMSRSMGLKESKGFDITDYKIKSGSRDLKSFRDQMKESYHPSNNQKLVLLKDIRVKTEESLFDNSAVFERLYHVKKSYKSGHNEPAREGDGNNIYFLDRKKHRPSKSHLRVKQFDFETTKRAEKGTTNCSYKQYIKKRNIQEQKDKMEIKQKEDLIRARIRENSGEKRPTSQQRCKAHKCSVWNKISLKEIVEEKPCKEKKKPSKQYIPIEIKPMAKTKTIDPGLGSFYDGYKGKKMVSH